MSLGDASWEMLIVLGICGLFVFTFLIIWISVKQYLERQGLDNLDNVEEEYF